eukprot:TRINITY_DN2849_c0_g1_i3.p1 TRINITY_DN2849_c0_g1~~TRINITY_DN2849_c0_g1_i3.p1  ORF type:complete len:349 (+),score=44.76 TRINITY_DN2849_c0_g1_i3:969-2015(+)
MSAGFPEEVCKLVMESTIKASADNSHWRIWANWCLNKGLDPLKVDKRVRSEFLAFKNNVTKTTLLSYIKAIDTTWEFIQLTKNSQHSSMVEGLLLSAAARRKPQRPKYSKLYDVDVLVKHVENVYLRWKTIKELRDVCIVLFRIFGLNRSLEVAQILISQLDMKEFTYKWVGSKSDKNKSLVSEAVSIPIGDGALKFRDILGEYLKRRKPSNCPYLFTSVVRGEEEKPLKVDTIKSICRDFLRGAGIDTNVYKAHSIRHATATSLIKKGTPIDEVMRMGRWKMYTTLLKHYLKVDRNSDAKSILMNAPKIGPDPLDVSQLEKNKNITSKIQSEEEGHRKKKRSKKKFW